MAFTIDSGSSEPPFEQLRRQVTEQATDGRLPAGHHLPTVRALADTLGLAPNTVAKAYRALETSGVVETHGRRGTFVASIEPGDAAAATYVRAARDQGLDLDRALRMIERHWA
ncbi:GntR family transcriptional regulator [Aeromicrobium stalagmiti]|uniref:GntR family transcriptional regulator n=1 Tax=Aeromicrobium stalagmiti TaxID=2738988 RepID=UPI001567F254|nr:GntR family transcriptional regulator [Aeromicrobium stalagmiti]NRQ49805.1 GntR family transcriptional regulator [Aeromicrobium stalagmiti]